jgi:hypothetical protein
MEPDEAKFLELLRRLIVRTQAGDAEWDEGLTSDSFIYAAKTGSVVVRRVGDGWGAELLNPSGTTLVSLRYRAYHFGDDNDPMVRDVVSELYAIARQTALDVSGTLDKFLEEL